MNKIIGMIYFLNYVWKINKIIVILSSNPFKITK